MSSSISVRTHILWHPSSSPSEPTDTLVLTSPSGSFVDIRILKDAVPGASSEGPYIYPIYPTSPHPQPRLTPVASAALPISALDWAFAGKCVSETRSDNPDINNGRPYRFTTWHHAIDSRHREANNISDSGSMFPAPGYPSGDYTLELGAMVNPDTGHMADYEELWQDLPVEAAGGEGKVKCVVLELQSEKAKGMVVRLGRFCQGVVRAGDAFGLERWEVGDGDGKWKRKYRVGEVWLPCGTLATMVDSVARDGEVTYEDQVWKVTEAK